MNRTCNTCNISKYIDRFEDNRNKCRDCRNKEARERREAKKRENIVKYKCYEMSSSAYSRVFAKSRSHKKGYRGLKDPYNFDGVPDMSDFLYENFELEIKNIIESGESPSVDRIDSDIGYTKENIRVISHKENTLLGVEKRKVKVGVIDERGTEIIYESIEECRVAFGEKHERTIRGWLDENSGYIPPKGYTFYRVASK